MAKKLKVLATANGKKPPVGRMIPVTGVRINRDGTIDVMGSGKSRPNPKKRRATKKNRPKVTKKRPANPSVRKSKKTFRKYAKRLGVALPKRLPRKLTHSKANPEPRNKFRVVREHYNTAEKTFATFDQARAWLDMKNKQLRKTSGYSRHFWDIQEYRDGQWYKVY